MKRRKTEPCEPVWGGKTSAENMQAGADWLRENRQQQIEKHLALYREAIAKGEVSPLTRRTPLEFIKRRIAEAANTMRSWHAFGEPSPYGKAVCSRLREEIICLAAIKRQL